MIADISIALIIWYNNYNIGFSILLRKCFVTNIKRNFFETIQKGRKFEVSARNYKFKTIFSKYSDIVDFNLSEEKRFDEGRGLVVFNSSNYLEIAVYKSNSSTVGSATTLMGLNMRDTVSVNFIND